MSVHGSCRHTGYETRVRYALGNTYLAAGSLPEAEEECSQVAALAEGAGDTRWQCNALLLKSRIGMKRNPGSAEILAFDALERAQRGGRLEHVMCEIDALLVRGECRYLRGDLTGAYADFLRVREHYGEHLTKRWKAECVLQLARIELRRNQLKQADGYLDEWRALEKDVEYRAVLELPREVKRERQQAEKNFFIPRDVENLNFEAHVGQLRNFLLERAKETSRTKEEIAEKLHISRQTLHNWLKSAGD
jgi:predicted DNA-binding protein (UPF0251 family)